MRGVVHAYNAAVVQALAPIATGICRPLRVMLVGDSMTNHSSGRTKAIADILAAYGVVDFVGPNENYSGTTTDYTLLAGRHNGFDGAKLEDFDVGGAHDIRANIGTYQPDVIMLQLGTNNVGSSQSCATMIAYLTSLLGTLMSVGIRPQNVLVSTIPPYLLDATKDRQRVLYNADLWRLGALMGFSVYHGGGSLVVGDIDAGDHVHPTDPAGYTKLGAAWARGFAAKFGRAPDSRSLVPRAFATHAAQSGCVFNASTARIVIATSANNALVASASWVSAFWIYPTDVAAGWGQVLQYGDPATPGMLWYFGNTGQTNLMIAGSTILQQPGRIAVNTWHRVVLVADATAGTITQYVNGATRLPATTTWAALPVTKQWNIGWGQGAGANSMIGNVCDFTLCLPTAAGFRIPTRKDIWDDYYECTPGNPTLPGVSAYWPMHEGVGNLVDSFGGGAGTLASVDWAAITMPGG